MRLAQPDMIICRWYDEDEGLDAHIFIQLFFDEDGRLLPNGSLFTVKDGDSYNELEYDQIVFAEESESGGGSVQLCTFTIGHDDGQRVMVCGLDFSDLQTIVDNLLITYNNQDAPLGLT